MTNLNLLYNKVYLFFDVAISQALVVIEQIRIWNSLCRKS